MKITPVEIDEIKMVGVSARTSNQNESQPSTAKIGQTVQYYMGGNLAQEISDRKNPGRTLAVYTDYESDEHGMYTYGIGEEVTEIKNLHSPLSSFIIPAGKYAKITTDAGKIPEVVIQAWQKIWGMSPETLGGQRAYRADFEVYDERAADPNNAIIDIYIGLK